MGGGSVSTKTTQRRLAIKQRQHLKTLGYDDRQIEAFAQLFKPAEQPDPTLPPCEQPTR
jgi:hypothetical protein